MIGSLRTRLSLCRGSATEFSCGSTDRQNALKMISYADVFTGDQANRSTTRAPI